MVTKVAISALFPLPDFLTFRPLFSQSRSILRQNESPGFLGREKVSMC